MRAGRGDPGGVRGCPRSAAASFVRTRGRGARSRQGPASPAAPPRGSLPVPGWSRARGAEEGKLCSPPPPSSPGGTKSPGSRPVLPGCWRSWGGAGRLCPGLLSLCSGIPPGRPRELLLLRDFGDHQQGAAVRTSNVNTGVSTKGNSVSGRFKEERRAQEAWRTPVRKPQKPPLGTGGPAGMVGPQDRWCRNLLAKICCLQ